jgi:formylglycine-generating enzyme required for sulfatase activity
MTRRLAVASSLEQDSILDHEEEWLECIDEIALLEVYDGLEIPAQMGLVPLGFDDTSGLAEFWHLETGRRPLRTAAGTLQVGEDTGLVFVLLPGGEFTMGAHPLATARNRDPHATGNERPVHRITLQPFLLSKYEMTQGQWLHFTGVNPSAYRPGTVDGDKVMTLCNPVETVTWERCREVLAKLGLDLPTEAQWEYGARGGTQTPWWTGHDKESVRDAANLVDRYCRLHGGHPDWHYEEWLDDGWSMHAPPGTYRANPYGLHEVIGNLAEWCLDHYLSYDQPVREGTGERILVGDSPVGSRVFRGGSFLVPATECRSSVRYVMAGHNGTNDRGVRPARTLDR